MFGLVCSNIIENIYIHFYVDVDKCEINVLMSRSTSLT